MRIKSYLMAGLAGAAMGALAPTAARIAPTPLR